MKDYVAPSLLAANKEDLLNEIKKVEQCSAEYLHWDIMDGIFVPNTSFSVDDVKKFAKSHKMVNDVHIMVADPKEVSKQFVEAGADLITFHYEAVECPICAGKIINYLHDNNVKAGISIKPKTKVKEILPLLDKVDVVLVMSVEPGKGGQKFMPNALRKIRKLRHIIDKNGYNCLIEVDGGINDITGHKCRKAGADILVAGSYLFGHDDIKERIDSLR
ncbi:MAG TPA: ribulose-phosphate 3-epimerase [Firmicutes bacterium]|nr:ribulose-phosphate 3-epimerase [Bacillota bacterium]